MPLHDEYSHKYLSEFTYSFTYSFTKETSRKENSLPYTLGKFIKNYLSTGLHYPITDYQKEDLFT